MQQHYGRNLFVIQITLNTCSDHGSNGRFLIQGLIDKYGGSNDNMFFFYHSWLHWCRGHDRGMFLLQMALDTVAMTVIL